MRFSIACLALVYYSLVCDRHQHHILACLSVILFTCLLLTCLVPIHLIGVLLLVFSSFLLVVFVPYMVVFQLCSGHLFSLYFVC